MKNRPFEHDAEKLAATNAGVDIDLLRQMEALTKQLPPTLNGAQYGLLPPLGDRSASTAPIVISRNGCVRLDGRNSD
jgi:hypothetical protein